MMYAFERIEGAPIIHKSTGTANRSRSPALGLCSALLFLAMFATATSCGNAAPGPENAHAASSTAFRLQSAAFQEGTSIPARFSCEGEDVSPPLAWTGAPSAARSFALIVEDPDAPAGVWTHWVAYDLPAQTRALQENTPKQGELPGGGLQGRNSFGRIGYGGPCPPAGNAHRYFFRLYALDTTLGLRAGADKQQVLAAMKGHIVGRTELMGRFQR